MTVKKNEGGTSGMKGGINRGETGKSGRKKPGVVAGDAKEAAKQSKAFDGGNGEKTIARNHKRMDSFADHVSKQSKARKD